MKTKKIIGTAIDVFAILFFVYLVIFPDEAGAPTRDALAFCGNTLIPSLFIYMVLSKIITASPITALISEKFGIESLFLVLGSVCGAPIGAKLAHDMYVSGKLTKTHAEYLCSFSNNASVSFVIGYVGNTLLGNKNIGIRLFVIQVISAAATAFVMRYVMFGTKKLPRITFGKANKADLREAISDSALTVINLCACVIFFMALGNVMTKILSLGSTSDAILRSILEFSSGCAEASDEGMYALPIIAFSLGFTGLSVAMQVRSVTEGRLSLKPYFTGKMIGCAIMTLLVIICG